MFKIYRKGEDGKKTGPPADEGYPTEREALAVIEVNRGSQPAEDFIVEDDGNAVATTQSPVLVPPPPSPEKPALVPPVAAPPVGEGDPDHPSGQLMISDPFYVYRKGPDGQAEGEPVSLPCASEQEAQNVLENRAVAFDVEPVTLTIAQAMGECVPAPVPAPPKP